METLSKSEYAAHQGVSAGRVTQWITSGKIPADALAGEGRLARVIVDRADKALADRLDAAQRHGLNGISPRAAKQPVEPSPPGPRFDQQIAEQKALQSRLLTERMAREARIAAGEYVPKDDHRRAVAETVQRALRLIEGGLTQIAQDLAGEFKLPARDVAHALRQAFRRSRARAAETFRTMAADEPDILEDAKLAELEAADE